MCICANCLTSLEIASPTRITTEYNRSFRHTGKISSYFGLYIFHTDSPIQNIIHSIKYSKKFTTAFFLGQQLGNALCALPGFRQVDMIIPLPLHVLRFAERGYNQSAFIAKGVASVLPAEVSSRIIKRVKNTPSQTGLNAVERKVNMAQAFRVVSPAEIGGRHLLLVDDVKTTGATIEECAAELVKYNPAGIVAASLAIAD